MRFLGGHVGLYLLSMSFGLDMMGVERKHHPGGQVITAGHHHGRTGSQQFEEHGLRICGPRVVDDDNAQILDRQGGLRQFRSLDDQLPVRDGKPRAQGRELYRFADHRRLASIVGGTDAADGIN